MTHHFPTSRPVQPELIVEAGRTERHYWRDLWHYRELLYFLAWRDILVRYKQAVAGIAWAVVRPLVTMVVFTAIFGLLGRFPSGGVPYPILVFTAMLPWQFFASALSDSSGSLVGNTNLISKVYFPRLIIPVSAIIVSFVDFLITSLILVGLMAWYHFLPDARIITLPFFIAVAFAAALGPGLWLTALTVKYRDFRFVTPFIVQIGLYISPVGYSSDLVRERFGETVFQLYCLNPMVGVIDGFRWAVLGGKYQINWTGFGLSLAIVALLLVTGIRYFRQTEKRFADVI